MTVLEGDILRLENVANIVADLLIKETAEEWKAQGHDLTGAYVQSLEKQVKKETDRVVMEVYGNVYGRYLETGVSASRVPYARGSGAKTSKYIDALVAYVKLRFVLTDGDKQARQIAFAIANKHKKEGMPTAASARFSTTGERTRFISRVLDRNEDTVAALAEAEIARSLDLVMTNIALEFSRQQYINALKA